MVNAMPQHAPFRGRAETTYMKSKNPQKGFYNNTITPVKDKEGSFDS